MVDEAAVPGDPVADDQAESTAADAEATANATRQAAGTSQTAARGHRRPASQRQVARAPSPPRRPPVPRRPMASAIGGSSSRCRPRRPTSAPATTPWRWRSTFATGSRSRSPTRPVSSSRSRARAPACCRRPETTGSWSRLETGLRWALGQVPADLGFRVHMQNQVPIARGLGSSAAATVAGLVAADALTGDGLDQRRLLTLSIEIEGHPDNATAALLGGFVVIAMVDGRPETVRFEPPRDLRAVLFIPDKPLSTSAMRAALPHEVPHRDAVFNIGARGPGCRRAGRRTAPRSCARRPRTASTSRIAPRSTPSCPSSTAAARAAGALGACLSGSGSTVIAFGDSVRGLTQIEAAFLATAAGAGPAGHGAGGPAAIGGRGHHRVQLALRRGRAAAAVPTSRPCLPTSSSRSTAARRSRTPTASATSRGASRASAPRAPTWSWSSAPWATPPTT